MPEMIRKMTSMPADKLSFRDRGRIKQGAYADIVVFDPKVIADKASYLEPWHYPEGIVHVLVNGVGVILHGSQTDYLPGTLLKRAGA
jgi:N-acyl-D-amino-acid deacylase